MKKIIVFLKKQSSLRYIALGFLITIFLGSALLMIPSFQKQPVSYIDALYTSTSATCVTGLIVCDVYDNFTIGGQIIVMLLIQIGGLGVTTLGAGLIASIKRRLSAKDRVILQDSLNVDSLKGISNIITRVFIYTFVIEFIGACLSLISFSRNYSLGEAIWKSIFHSVASFNNSGFDILGGGTNLIPYQNDILLNIVTCVLIVLGGLGFIVIYDLLSNKFNLKKLQLHSKVVLLMTVILILIGGLTIKLSELDKITWLGAFFTSVSSRTAGFSTFSIDKMTDVAKLTIIVLMFIGASPCSTGGGIKTTTLYVLIKSVQSMLTHKSPKAFKYSLSDETIKKSIVILFLALSIVIVGTFSICMIETNVINHPDTTRTAYDVLFEVVSAYGTVGLSTGITSELSIGSKIICIIIMYLGRVGPLTFFSLWYSGKEESFRYPEGVINVG